MPTTTMSRNNINISGALHNATRRNFFSLFAYTQLLIWLELKHYFIFKPTISSSETKL